MAKTNLNQEEQKILASVEAGEWLSSDDLETHTKISENRQV